MTTNFTDLELRAQHPEIAEWERIRARIDARGKDLKDPARHKVIDEANLQDLKSIFTEALAMAVYCMPDIYSEWPAHWHDWVLRQYALWKHCAIGGPRRRAKSAMFRAHQMNCMLRLRWTFTTHICLSPQLVLEHSEAVITQLETNVRLQEAFDIHPGTVTRQEHFEVQVGNAHRTTLKFEWITRNGTPRGTGRHGVGIDDPDDPGDTPFMMMKYNDHFHSSVLGTLEDLAGHPAQILVAANLTGQYCNILQFQENDAVEHPDHWIVQLVPALELGETQHITKTVCGETTWPRFTTEETRQRIGEMNLSSMRSGDMEMLNKIADVGKLIWKRWMFLLKYKDGSVEPHHMVSRVYVDSAQKTEEAGDDWAIGRLTKVVDGPHKGEYWIEEVRMDPMDPDVAIDIAIELMIGNGSPDAPQCRMVKMGSKTDKGIDPWLNDLQKTARREHGMYIQVGMIVESKDKRTRAIRAQPIGTARALRTPDEWDRDMSRLVKQMCMFTGKEGKHLIGVDDGEDMVANGICDLKKVNRRREMEDRPQPRGQVRMRNRLRSVG